MELLSSFVRARLSVASVISLSFHVLRCCFRALIHFVRSAASPPRIYCRCRQPSYLSRRHLYIEGEGGRLFSSPMPAHHRGYILRNATIIHTADMTQPSQSALSKQSVHTGKTSTRQDISVGYFVQPGYAQDMRMLLRWNVLNLLSCRHICSPCLAAIHTDNTGNVDRHICLHRQLGACPHSSRETGES